MILIIGGSGSGKSAYAESCLTALPGQWEKYYIATMQVFDREGERKVLKHRRMRAEKGFTTIEQYREIGQAADRTKERDGTKKAALVECLSNLTANEMFPGEGEAAWEIVAEKIVGGIGKLRESFDELVVVTNNVFEDGVIYAEATQNYRKALGAVNERLAVMADSVIEVVVGIPVVVKERKAVCRL